MEQYCGKCGQEIRRDARFCPHCGQRFAPACREEGGWDALGRFLGRLGKALARGLLYLMLGGAIFACGISGGGMLIAGASLLYSFAASGIFTLPPMLAAAVGFESLGGPMLAFCGVTSIFVALLLVGGAALMIRGAFFSPKRGGQPAAPSGEGGK